MNLNKECLSIEKDTVVQRSENRKTFRILNGKGRPIEVYCVDGCLVLDEGKKCDYLFIICHERKEALFLVELKGTDHVRAVRQIIDAAEKLQIRDFSGVKQSFIVGAPAPKSATNFQKELSKQASRFKAVGLSLPRRKNYVLDIELT